MQENQSQFEEQVVLMMATHPTLNREGAEILVRNERKSNHHFYTREDM